MRRLLLACATSITLHAGLGAAALDRPLSHGALRARIDAALDGAGAIAGPKLVILAGSNASYSHRCETIAAALGVPCANAGAALGIGLDYLFTRWKHRLAPGDTVYLPLEFAQYARFRATARTGPDAAIMLRHDRATLAELAPDRWLGAAFAWNPRARVGASANAHGDLVGHTAERARANAAMLAAIDPWMPSAAAIAQGDGAREVAAFLDWARAAGVRAIGGLPTGFDDRPPPDDTVSAVRAIYARHGAAFLELPNRSRYPRTDFFDTADHLHETAQIAHSRAVAAGLAALQRP